MLPRVFRAEEPGSGNLRKYREQMNAIDENFRIYKSNETLIDENASEIMLTEVKKCSPWFAFESTARSIPI